MRRNRKCGTGVSPVSESSMGVPPVSESSMGVPPMCFTGILPVSESEQQQQKRKQQDMGGTPMLRAGKMPATRQDMGGTPMLHMGKMPVLRGFTLIEIMVVLIVLVIAAGVVVPGIMNSSDVQALSAARLIASDLQYAQNTAITSQANVKVTFTPGAGTYKLTLDDSQSTPLKNPITRADYIVVFSAGTAFDRLSIVSTTFAQNTMKFDATGAPDNAGDITVQAGSSIYRISVAAATGRVTVTSIGS